MVLRTGTMMSQSRRRSGASGVFLQDLIGWWQLNEASGNALDSHINSLHLTDNNGISAAEGARDFEANSSQFFNRASGTELRCGNIAYTIMVRFRAESSTNDMNIFSHSKNDYSFIDYMLWCPQTPSFRTWSAGLGGQKSVTYGTNCQLGQWHTIFCGLDAPDGNIFLTIDDATPVTAALAGLVPGTGAGQFNLGRYAAGEIYYYDGLISHYALWKRHLTGAERTWLYNENSGRTYAQVTAA